VTKLATWPVHVLLVPLLITTVLCKSAGALALLGIGLGVQFAIHYSKARILVVVLALLPCAYITARSFGGWSGADILSLASAVSQDRESSLATRLDNENLLVAKALQRPLFGWGGWGRNRVTDEETGEDASITDGLWVIAVGVNGMTGLAALFGSLLLPVALLMRKVPVRTWLDPAVAAPASLAVVLALYAIDCLFNAMVNPVFTVCAGALVSLASAPEAGLRIGIGGLGRLAPSARCESAAVYRCVAPASRHLAE
jgi:hypothetical protein